MKSASGNYSVLFKQQKTMAIAYPVFNPEKGIWEKPELEPEPEPEPEPVIARAIGSCCACRRRRLEVNRLIHQATDSHRQRINMTTRNPILSKDKKEESIKSETAKFEKIMKVFQEDLDVLC